MRYHKNVCVFITAGPSTKLFAWGGGDMGGHVLRETTSRGLCEQGCPSRNSERGGEGDCVKEGGGGEGKTMWVAVGFPYGPAFARASLRSGSRALARVALATLTMCA
jgi:hypothetical protein